MNSSFQKIRSIFAHPFSQDVASLQAGAFLGRLIAFATSLVFARILGPEDYGFYALVFALAGTVTIFLDFGTEQSTVNLLSRAYVAQDKKEAHSILAYFVQLSLAVLFTVGVIGVVVSPFLGKWFYDSALLGQLASILVFSSAVTFFLPLVVATMQVRRKIKGLTFLETLHKFFTSVAAIILLLLGYGVFGIVVGNLISMVVFSLIGVWLYRRLRRGQDLLPQLRDLPFIKLSWGKVKYFFKFGFQIALSKNFVKLNAQIPFLILGAVLATNSGLAFYKIAFAYMAIPSFLLAPISRLLNVQFPQTEELRGDKRLFKRFWQVSGLSMLLTFGLTIIMVALGPFLIKFFYGEDFSPAIRIMYGLALYPIFLSAGVGLGPLFRTLNKMKAAITINFVTLLLLIPVAFILINSHAIVGLVAVTLIFTFIPNFLSFIYLYQVSKKLE